MAITGLDPTSGPIGGDDERRLAPRPTSLSGHVVGLVANGLGMGEQMLHALYDELAKGDDVIGTVAVRKGSVSIPPSEDDWKRLTEGATVLDPSERGRLEAAHRRRNCRHHRLRRLRKL